MTDGTGGRYGQDRRPDDQEGRNEANRSDDTAANASLDGSSQNRGELEANSSAPSRAKPTEVEDAARRAYIRKIRTTVQLAADSEKAALASTRQTKKIVSVSIIAIIVVSSLAVLTGAVLAVVQANIVAGAPGLGALLSGLLWPLFRLSTRLTVDEERSEVRIDDLRRFLFTVELAEGTTTAEQRERTIARLAARMTELQGLEPPPSVSGNGEVTNDSAPEQDQPN